MAAVPPLLRLEGLSRYYGYRAALKDLDLEVRAGELLRVLGPNGAGKSSLLAALLSRSAPDEGRIFFRGEPLIRAAARRNFFARVGHLGHSPGLFLDLSARENLRLFAGLHGLTGRDSATLIETAIKRVGLARRADETPRSFSRGMLQRLGLARAFLGAPDLILLDEPLTGLDRAGAKLFRELLAERLAAGAACIAVTHEEEPLRGLGGRYLFLKEGRLAADIAESRYSEEARARAYELLYAG